jgi:AAA+ ATPase superfamily predicted ATPase
MKKQIFRGRKLELSLLKQQVNKKSASLTVITGRRRIGKTRLLEEFSENIEQVFRFSGLPPTAETKAQDQRNEFAKQYMRQTNQTVEGFNDWGDLFYQLSQQIKPGTAIIVFDEITWMGNKDPLFLGKLKNAWDLYFSQHSELLVVLCGSLSAWIEKNIESSTGFLGRISLVLNLKELSLKESAQFWPKDISAREILKVLAVTGGVPRYLEQIDYKETAEQNIHRLCFSAHGSLINEFEHLFSDLFQEKEPRYREILDCLASGSKELNQLLEELVLSRGGYISTELDELIQAGFISKDYSWNLKNGKLKKIARYRLRDNYSRYYLKYILPNKPRIQEGQFDQVSMTDFPNWSATMGLQVENLVLNNRQLIIEALHLNKSDIICDNPYVQRPTNRVEGCQIDYLVQTKHDTLYVCEIKFRKKEIKASIIDEVKNKISKLSVPRHISIRAVLIYCGELSEQVEDAQYFSHTIDLTEML